MSHIKVIKDSAAPSHGAPVGAYLVGNDLWLISYPGACPFYISNAIALVSEDDANESSAGSGISESALLKIIAITIDPKRQKDLVK